MKKYIKYIDDNLEFNSIYGKSYSIARLLLSLSTFVTIAFNDEQRLFNISFVQHPNIKAIFLSRFSIFNLCYPNNLLFAKIFSCSILFFIMLGFLPRITAFFQWWLSFSVYASAYITEGGDQINMILSFLIIPICLFDNRVNFWKTNNTNINIGINPKITIFISIIIIKFQIALLYFISGFSKIYNDQWREGTALYYWVGNNDIGFNKFIEPFFRAIFNNRYILFFSTWSIMIFEIIFSFVLITNLNKKLFFRIGLLFHFLIFFCFGLFSFGLSMSAALFLYFLQINKNKNNE